MDELLALCDVRLYYERGHRRLVRVLEGVSLSVWPGEVVCVLARRGQGKSTLMRIAAGLQPPASGLVRFAGQDLWALGDCSRAKLVGREIGWVAGGAPEPDTPATSALRDVAMPVLEELGRGAARERAAATLESLEISHCAELVWLELDDRERALLKLARAVVGRPRLLVVDDLTVALDAVDADQVGRLLARLAGELGCAVLVGVSGVRETRRSDRIATLSGGELLMPEAGRAPQRAAEQSGR